MYESTEDLQRLQVLLDRSHERAGEHLRSIFTPERRMCAAEVVQVLKGVFVLQLATVTAAHEPRVAPIDGLFFRGRFWFGLPPGAVRADHLRVRPQVSAVYTRGEDVCVIAHGRAREVHSGDPLHASFVDYSREVYGPEVYQYWQDRYLDREGREYTGWVDARRLFAMSRGSEASSS